MEKVFPLREPSGEGAQEIYTALKNETVSFQIAYRWSGEKREWGNVKINAPREIAIHVRTAALVPCAYPSHCQADDDYLTTEPGLYPDRLEELNESGFPMILGQWRSLWVDVEAEETTPAGIYPIEISIGVEGHMQTVKVQVEILDAVLPKLDIPHTEWFHCDCLANYYGVEVFSEEHWRIVENFIAAAVRRGCNMILTPIFTPPLDTAPGKERRTVQLVDVWVTDDGYRFGYDRFERWIAICRKCRVTYFEMSHLFSQWGAAAAPKIMGYENGELRRIFGWETPASGEAYAAFLQEFLASFKEELKKLGIESQCYFHVSDEPSLEQLESYRAARAIVKESLQEFPIIDALSNYDFFEKGIVDEPVCSNDHIEEFLENPPEKLWTYYCTAQWKDVSNRFIALPGYRTRVLGVQMYKHQIAGFLHWGYNFYNCQYSLYPVNPYLVTDADGVFPAGDAFLVYPGADGIPEESIRLMLMEEAMNDLRAMRYLEKLTDRETVLECLGDEELTFKRYPRNLTYLGQVRMRVNRKISEAVSNIQG